MSRKDLKVLIKECLVEILAEGLGRELNEATSRPARHQFQAAASPRYQSMTHPSRGRQRQADDGSLPTQALKNAVMETANGNPIMQDILADTAMTTLPTMLAGAGATPPMPGTAEHIVAQTRPEEMFGEDANRWASLAFDSRNSSAAAYVPPPPPPAMRKLSDNELDSPAVRTKKTA